LAHAHTHYNGGGRHGKRRANALAFTSTIRAAVADPYSRPYGIAHARPNYEQAHGRALGGTIIKTLLRTIGRTLLRAEHVSIAHTHNRAELGAHAGAHVFAHAQTEPGTLCSAQH
jgi:hypothetical protein